MLYTNEPSLTQLGLTISDEGDWVSIIQRSIKPPGWGSYDACSVILSRQNLEVKKSLEHHVMVAVGTISRYVPM